MNRYFAGNTLAAFARTTTGVVEITTAGRFNSTYVSNAISIPSGLAETPIFSVAATGTIYARFDIYCSTYGAGDAPITLLNGGTNGYRVAVAAGSVFKLQYWNGSAWTDVGSTVSLIPYISGRTTFMLKVVMGTSMELFASGTSILSGSASMSGHQTSITKGQLGACGSSTAFSEVMIADYDLRDSHYAVSALNGVSAANTNGTGAVTTINETVLDDSTAAILSTSGHKRGFTHAGVTVPAGYIIAASVLSARGRVTGTIPDGKLGIRSGGTNYSSSGRTYSGGYEPRQRIDDTDPATATQFTQSGFNAAEPYLEAA